MTINRPAPHPLLSPVMENVVPPRFRGNMPDWVDSPSEPNTPTSIASQPQTITECVEELEEDHHPAGSSGEKIPKSSQVELARSSGQRQQGYPRSSPPPPPSSSSGYNKKNHDQHKGGDRHLLAVFVCCRRFHTQASLANKKSNSVKVHPFQRKPMSGSSSRSSHSKVKFSLNPFWILARLRDQYIGCMKSAASRNLTVIGGNIGTVVASSQEFTFTESQEFASTDSLADLLGLERSGSSSKQTRNGSRNGSRNGGRSLSRKGSVKDIDELFEKSKLRRSARKGDAENPYTDPYSRSKSGSASSSAVLANLPATAGQETVNPISQFRRCKSKADSEYRLKRLSASGNHRVSFDPSSM
jgi:hypothetical protein